MKNLTALELTHEMLSNYRASPLLRRMTKLNAICKIRSQPFFGEPLPNPTSGFVIFRRPVSYKVR